ncbi:MAG: hypothetical protein M3R01_04455 [Actinomycetota bacterium]|nr:hypothetical protein [Actinomycetota bacterium]
MLGAAGVVLAAPAVAQDEGEGGRAVVDVVEANGYLDPVLVEFVDDAITSAEDEEIEALVVQLDSPGSLVSPDRLDALVERVGNAEVPVAVWIGPSGAEALGGAARVALAAPLAGMAPGTRLGELSRAGGGADDADVPAEVRDGTVGPDEAGALDLVELNEEEAAVLVNFIARLDGRQAAGRALRTADFEPVEGGPPEATLVVQTRLAKLPLTARTMHTVASPPVAYLLLSAGLVLLVFEFFTAGVGVAGGVGAVCLVLSAYGLGVLPTRPLGLALCVVGLFGFSIDVQTGAPRFWTAAGAVAYAAGSLFLFEDGVGVGWLPLVAGVGGVALMMLAGLPGTVRSRFSTPTIGRSSMVGEMGEAVAAVRPDGVVRVRDALWPARTNRATPIAAGDRVRVVAIDGPRLEVEPETGGARDHRERR